MNNREFSVSPEFVQLCERTGIKPTKRQASKFKRKVGLAYNFAKKEKEANGNSN